MVRKTAQVQQKEFTLDREKEDLNNATDLTRGKQKFPTSKTTDVDLSKIGP